MIIRASLDDGLLERAQPGTDGQSALQQPVLPYVDMSRLLQRKGEAGRAVLQDRGGHAMSRFIAEYAGKGVARDGRLRRESLPQPEPRGHDGICRSEFAHNEDKIAGIAFDQVPTVGLKLVKDALGEAGRTEQLYRFLLPDEQTQQMVEANEMIDVRMRDKDLVNAP